MGTRRDVGILPQNTRLHNPEELDLKLKWLLKNCGKDVYGMELIQWWTFVNTVMTDLRGRERQTKRSSYGRSKQNGGFKSLMWNSSLFKNQ
jgi:hypothetical protein